MNCLLCGHDKVHKHGKTEKGKQRYKCPCCGKTFPEHFDSLYYGRHLAPEEVHTILQSHAEGSSLRSISRISGRAYGTVVELIREASQKAQMMHNQEVKQIETEEVIADEMSSASSPEPWSFALKKQKNCLTEELRLGDCWIGISLASDTGLILAARVGKHTDAFIEQLVNSTEGKTDSLYWNTDGWGGHQRLLPKSKPICLCLRKIPTH
jgi:transposase-like protein